MSLHRLRKAGRDLAVRLAPLEGIHPVVVAIPRRGMIVGLELSRALGAPFDIRLVGKVFARRTDASPIGGVTVDGALVADPGGDDRRTALPCACPCS